MDKDINMSISSLLFRSRDPLISSQTAMDLAGGNIAKVDRPGYNRQRTDLSSVVNVSVKSTSARIGVAVSRIKRVYNRIIESQINNQQKNTGYSDSFLQGFRNIEVKIEDTQGGGIGDRLNKFWSAWGDLSKNPGGIVEQSPLFSAGEKLHKNGAFL
jgi:flagellar hook-associated protein 1